MTLRTARSGVGIAVVVALLAALGHAQPPAPPAGGALDAITMEVEILRVDRGTDANGDVRERFVPVSEGVPGDVVEYRIVTRHEGTEPIAAGRLVVTVPLDDRVAYLAGSAGPVADDAVLIDFSADGGDTFSEPPVLVEGESAEPEAYDAIRWTFTAPYEPGQEETLYYRVEVL